MSSNFFISAASKVTASLVGAICVSQVALATATDGEQDPTKVASSCTVTYYAKPLENQETAPLKFGPYDSDFSIFYGKDGEGFFEFKDPLGHVEFSLFADSTYKDDPSILTTHFAAVNAYKSPISGEPDSLISHHSVTLGARSPNAPLSDFRDFLKSGGGEISLGGIFRIAEFQDNGRSFSGETAVSCRIYLK